ncbi:hypothetical protein QN277_013882 [Acacia crassicarpa]|uniref:RNase H type-1 domain-containing protein n=1 Tax=Acacia crassicarpa TaxID=499986 RepID=A0AAE1N3D3_9FABA|nr:hypothetical protein QN277_013882 [Acacia crassicarpa]
MGMTKSRTRGIHLCYLSICPILRDHLGDWIAGFVHILGSCSVYEAEEWAILKGLHLTWDLSFRRVVVESDAKELVDSKAEIGRDLIYWPLHMAYLDLLSSTPSRPPRLQVPNYFTLPLSFHKHFIVKLSSKDDEYHSFPLSGVHGLVRMRRMYTEDACYSPAYL